MAKPNYQYEKRQRELAKKAKKAEKAARKASGAPDDEGESQPDQVLDDAATTSSQATPDALPKDPA